MSSRRACSVQQEVLMFAALLFITPSLLQAQSPDGPVRTRIAVMTLDAQNVNDDFARSVTEMIVGDLAATGAFEVVERQQMDKVMAEQGLQMSGAVEAEQMAEMGKILAAEKIFTGSVGRFSFGHVILLKMIDVSKGTIELADKQVATNELKLLSASTACALSMASYLAGGKVFVVENKKFEAKSASSFSSMKVINAYDNVVEISGGVNDGLKKDDVLTVYMIDKMSGMEKIKENIKVNKVDDYMAVCKARKRTAFNTASITIVAGDLVRKADVK